MTGNDKEVDGLLVMEKIEFNRVLKRKVIKNNKSSGKITLPRDLVNKKVIVVIPKVDG